MKKVNPKLEVLNVFEKEIKALDGAADIQDFVKKVLVDSSISYWGNEEFVKHTQKVFMILEGMLAVDQVNSPVREVMLAGVLLSDICRGEEEVEGTHNLLAIIRLEKFKDAINPNYLQPIFKIVNAHEGSVQIQGTEPKAGAPDHLIATANTIARIPGITIS